MRTLKSSARAPRRMRIAAIAMVCASALALTACSSLFGDYDSAPAAAGSPFSQALFKDYGDLSSQAAALPLPAAPEDDGFFSSITGMFDSSDSAADLLSKTFDAKAQLAARGDEPPPEAAPDTVSDALRQRLMRAVAAGKEQFPEESARAQSDYDCWVLYGTVPAAAAASQACKTQLDRSLPHLEQVERPAPPAPPPPPPPVASAPVPAPAAQSDYTVYFDFDSWTLTAEDLSVITQIINTARAGGQSHITIVGHTDTSGSAGYNMKLSVHRANVVVEALVDMGARRAAIKATGVGETDLAVQTPDGVKEAKNRRAVIDLQP